MARKLQFPNDSCKFLTEDIMGAPKSIPNGGFLALNVFWDDNFPTRSTFSDKLKFTLWPSSHAASGQNDNPL